MKNDAKCLNLQCVDIGDYPKPYWDFSYIVLWGVGISNDQIDLCQTPPHIITSVNIGGSNGYIN